MKIEILRQKRKTIVLKIVDSENAVLKVPQNASEKKVNDFLESKKNWLAKNSQKLKKDEDFSSNFQFDKFVYLNGKPIMPVQEIEIGFDKLNSVAKQKSVDKYYKSMFSNLEKRAEELSSLTGLTFDEIKMLDSKRVWGSYNSKRLMKLNWKLVILPEELSNYVICHELCHSIHMNHKPQFWKDVEKICPDYKKCKKALSTYSFLLKTKF